MAQRCHHSTTVLLFLNKTVLPLSILSDSYTRIKCSTHSESLKFHPLPCFPVSQAKLQDQTISLASALLTAQVTQHPMTGLL